MNIDALDHFQLEAGIVDFLLKRLDLFERPELPGGDVHQGADHTSYTGNLADVFQGNRVKAAAVPAKCHFHALFSPSFFRIDSLSN